MKFFLFENPFSPILTSFYSNNKEIFDSLTYNLRATQGWLANPQLSDFLLPFFPIKISQLPASLGLVFLLTFLNFSLQKKPLTLVHFFTYDTLYTKRTLMYR